MRLRHFQTAARGGFALIAAGAYKKFTSPRIAPSMRWCGTACSRRKLTDNSGSAPNKSTVSAEFTQLFRQHPASSRIAPTTLVKCSRSSAWSSATMGNGRWPSADRRDVCGNEVETTLHPPALCKRCSMQRIRYPADLQNRRSAAVATLAYRRSR